MKIKTQPPIAWRLCAFLKVDSFKPSHACMARQQRANHIKDRTNGKKAKLQSDLFSALRVQIGETGQMMQHFADYDDQKRCDTVDQKRDADLICGLKKAAHKEYVER